MANLFDLELQESHLLIDTLIHNGETPTLIRLRTELADARNRGDAQQAHDYESHDTPVGRQLKRCTELESDIRSAMLSSELTPALASQAKEIFNRHPETLDTLNDADRQVIMRYWVKKKAVLQRLSDLHYTFEEACE